MWTPATRGRMAKIEKKTKRYPSDLTDEEWARIEPVLPRASKAGRPIEVDLREVLNAIRYVARSGGGWRMLPNDFPPWQTVYWWFRRFVRRFMFQTIHDVALMLDRKRDEDTLAQRRSAGSYVPRPNRLGIQNWRMAATTVGMSRHASRPKDGVLGPRHCVSRTGRPAGSTQWNKIGSSSPCSMAFGFSNRDHANRRSFMTA